MRYHRPKIVVIGGGTGLPVVLKGLREQDCDITAVVTVADDGGSSGEIREIMNVSPPGDLRNVLVSLSRVPEIYKQLFQYRFSKDKKLFSNHTIGNLVIAALTDMENSTYEAIQILADLMQVDGHIYPASEDGLTLNAVFTDGSTAVGESTISAKRKMIDQVFVTRTSDQKIPTASRNVVSAIMEADMIVLGPGSLFTSILPNLMIPDIGKAVLETKAQVVYICNIMTQKGETEKFTDADHVRVLHRHLKQPFIDTVLVNIEPVPENYMDTQKYDEYLVQVAHDFKGLRAEGCRVISDNFIELRDKGVFHNEQRVVDELMHLVYDKIG